MSKGDWRFDFVMEFQGEDFPDMGLMNGDDIRVKGVVTRYVPARTNCSNDDACPEEGGEIEDLEIWHGKVQLSDPDGVLFDDVKDMIFEKADDAATNDAASRCDAAEARADAAEWRGEC